MLQGMHLHSWQEHVSSVSLGSELLLLSLLLLLLLLLYCRRG
jgi:hypothetical protein